MLKEFREFALRGNVMDMAVGIIIGAAFTTIVQSLVDDVLMPPLGVIMGGVDVSEYYVQLTMRDQTFGSLRAARDAGAAVIAFGSFINAIIKFLIVAFALFLVIKQMNRLREMVDRPDKATPPDAPPPPPDIVLLTEIRDTLRAQAPARQ